MEEFGMRVRNIHTDAEHVVAKVDYVLNGDNTVKVYVLDNGDRWNVEQFWLHHKHVKQAVEA